METPLDIARKEENQQVADEITKFFNVCNCNNICDKMYKLMIIIIFVGC